MNKTIRLSLVAFMLLSANVVSAQTQLTNDAIILANAQDNISAGKNIISNTYQTPTDINHTGGNITLGNVGELHSIDNININSNFAKAQYWVRGDVYLNNVSFQKPSGGNAEHSLIVKNNSNLTMFGGSLNNIAINLETSSGSEYQDSIILDNVKLDNVKYGYKTDKSANFAILNSNVNNSDFKHETIFMTSTLSGDITGNLNIQENSTILGNIQATNLNISDTTASGSKDKKINISSNGSDMQLNNVTFNDVNLSSGTYRIDLNGENTFNRLLVQNTNVKGSGHHITLGDKAQATFNDSEFINTAINNYSFKFNNTTIFNNSKFTNTSIGSASAASAAKVYINNSVINNTDAKATLGGGNIHITNSTINSDITGGNIFFDNLSTIQGTLRGGTIHVNNHNFNKTQNLVIKSGGIYSSGILDLDGIKNFEDSETNLEFGVDNNATLNLTNMKIANTGMHSANVNEEELVNNSINISDSNLIEVGIGNRNNGGLSFVVDNLSLSNTDIKNTNKAIKAKNIKITGGNITATELRTINQILISPLYWHVNKLDTNIIIDNATINANVETGTLTLKNNSILNGDIQGTNKVIIDNATLNGNITRNDRGYCLIEEGCTGEIEDVSITNSTIKGNVNEVGNITLNNSSLESTSVIVKNDVKIDNSANIQGSFKVGNNLTLTNSAITGDIEEVKNLNLNDSNITTNKVVSASNDITITNTTKQTSSANYSAGNNFTSSNTEFSGNITTNNLLSDNNSTFKGEVVADSINAVGSTFDNTLTITGNSKNNILDNAKLNHGINVNNKDASLSIVNNSTILGSIVNNGIINVEEGSEVSKEVTGTGVLNTNSAFYEDKVEIGTIVGSNNTFKGDVTITNDEANFSVDTNHFHGDIIVSNGTLNASTNNDLNNIISNNINFKNEDVNTKDEINAKVVEVKDTLLIENIDVNTSQISAKQAQITNSNVTSKIFLKGNDDKATSVYDKAEITSGNYTINNSAIKGGIRVDSLSVNNSNIVGQLAVNKLNATNSTFYITGGGYNTSLYEHFSGAIIAKEGASGGNNTINISNTNIGKLINGYVPVAIINNKAPNAIRADMLAASPKIVEQEFFKVTYTTPISTIFLSPSIVHYNKIDDGTSIKEIWSVGLAGKELSESEVIDIINGKGNANYSTTQAVDKNYKDYIMSEVFDNATKKELNSIIYNPYFVAKNNLDILNDRYTYLRANNKNHGFWLDNNYSYNFYNDIKLKNKGISVGVDNFIDLDKLSVSYGAFTNTSRLSLDNAKIDTKLIGAYASTNFYNGVFIDYSLAYASLKHKFDAKKLEFNNTYYTNLWQASIKTGHRLGTTSYIEPSLEINATRFQKHNVKTKNVQITANQGTLVSLKTGVKAGVDLNKNFSLKTELAYYNDLNKSPKANVVSMLESDFSGIRDYGLNAKLGLLVKPSNKLDINADIAKKISLTNESNYKVNLGFNYKF